MATGRSMGVRLDREVTRLRAENAALRVENAELRRENAELRRENAELRQMLHAALTTIESLRTEVADLRARLNANSTNSALPPSSDSPRVRRPHQPPSTRKQGGQPGHPGHQRPLFPPEQVHHVIPRKPTECSRCHRRLRGTDPNPTRHQVAELPSIQPVVTEYRLHELVCVTCGAKTRARLPPEANRFLGPRATATATMLTGRFHLTKRQTSELFEDIFGLRLSPSTISRCEQVTSEAIAQPVEEVWRFVQRQPVRYVDPTGWREQKKRVWLWVAATSQAVGFSITNTHARSVVRQVVGDDLTRRLVSDRGREYEWYPTEKRQVCWAHLKRNFKGWSEREGAAHRYGEKLLELTRALFHVWHRFERRELTRRGLRQRMRPIREEVEAQLEAASSVEEQWVARRAAGILKLRKALWMFVDEEGVDPTNNLSERMLRQGVIWRKLSYGTQSERGSRFVERMLTVYETLKSQGRGILSYLSRVIEADRLTRSVPTLLPAPAQAASVCR